MNLLSVQGRGALYTICIAFFCIIIVHIFKLALLGWKALRNRQDKKQAPQAPEPVYYIVEKKKKSAPKYEKPKKINFEK